MSNIEDFLTHDEEQEIIDTIRVAERNTSGEIRIHLERTCQGDTFKHAMEVFHFLKMDNTLLRNGVLIYIALDKKALVIYGDKGIHEKVGDMFWESTKDLILSNFKRNKFKEGLIQGVLKAGKMLETHFPWRHGDINELDNTISKG